MKKLYVVLVFSLMIVFSSCKKDETLVPDIYGSWTVLQTDSQGQSYNVELRFNTDNTYDWILLDSVEGHSDSHAEFQLTDNVMVITKDVDCDGYGEYLLIREQDKLAIVNVVDDCSLRANALEYLWDKK
jgi:hypothetical protein